MVVTLFPEWFPTSYLFWVGPVDNGLDKETKVENSACTWGVQVGEKREYTPLPRLLVTHRLDPQNDSKKQ